MEYRTGSNTSEKEKCHLSSLTNYDHPIIISENLQDAGCRMQDGLKGSKAGVHP